MALSTFHWCLGPARFPSLNAVLPVSSLPLGPQAPHLASCLRWQTQQHPTWGITDGERSCITVLWLENCHHEKLCTQSPLAGAYGSTLQPRDQAFCGGMQPGPFSEKSIPEKLVQGHASQPSCSSPALHVAMAGTFSFSCVDHRKKRANYLKYCLFIHTLQLSTL